MSNILKNTKDVVRKMEEIINEKGPAKDGTAKPNVLEFLKSKAGLQRGESERKSS